tara:strand:+ start:2660 stop:4147 length:1488 start_codon:yes stop_codon:yes gene_type:complete
VLAFSPSAKINPFFRYLFSILYLFRNRQFDELHWGDRLTKCLIELGPSFIKFGQTLATRSDLLGDESATALSLLQDRLPPFPFSEAKTTVEQELGFPTEQLFSSFNESPVAAASIAQVHYAITVEGNEVAVKILRPNIEIQFSRDIGLFFLLARILEYLAPTTRRFHPVQIVEVFSKTVELELDLRMEASAASELADNFKDDLNFKVPQIDWKRTSRRVLTLEKLSGYRPDDRDGLLKSGLQPKEILKKSACIFFHQVFRDGFFHADMHPGNVFVLKDGRIAPVDFGIMGRLDIKTRFFLADMLTGFLTRDYRRVAEVHFQAGYVPRDQSVEVFAQACRSIGEPILGLPLAEISLAKLLSQLFRITEQFRMETQPQLLLLQKTMLVAEGVGRQVDSSVNIWELAHPLIEQWMNENKSGKAQLHRRAAEILHFMERLPVLAENTEIVINQLAKGDLRMDPNMISSFQKHKHKVGWKYGWLVGFGLLVVIFLSIALS